MTTRAIVPNGDGEGSLGTSTAKWGAVYSSDPVSGENSGQVPTTAWVQKLLADALAKQKAAYEQAISTAVSAAQTKAKLDAHPVGSYYFSDKSTSPADLFGGTWEALPAGYTLIAAGKGKDEFGDFEYIAGQMYGERLHRLTAEELAKHRHAIHSGYALDINSVSEYKEDHYRFQKWGAGSAGWQLDGLKGTNFVGGDTPHNNVPPSLAGYAWRRQQ